MFGKKSVVDPKKSAQKFLDQKKDSVARLKHLKSVVENVDVAEAKALFESSYSAVYSVFYDQFINIEANLRQRVHRGSREELDVVLTIFEKILLLLPELISRKWQCHSIGRLMKKLLHPGNTIKLRREAMRLFLLWYQILGENAPCDLHWIFGCLVPGFFITTDKGIVTLETIVSGAARDSYDETSAEGEEVSPLEIAALLPPHLGEKQSDAESQFFLEGLMDHMVTQVHKIMWRDKTTIRQQKCFQFLFDNFKKYYISNIFEDFNWNTSIYIPCLDLPEWNFNCISADKKMSNEPAEGTLKMCLIPFKVVIIKWFAVFLSKACSSSSENVVKQLVSSHSQDQENMKETKNNCMSPEINSEKHQIANNDGVVVIDKDASYLQNKIQAITRLDHSVVMQILYSNRENINLIQEVFRQAFLLPWTEAQTMRRVIAVYREWIITGKETPPFMAEPDEIQREDKGPAKRQNVLNAAMEDSQLKEGSPFQVRRSRNDVYHVAYDKSASVRAGLQKSLQVVITHTSNVFLQMVEAGNWNLLDEQVDMCKRVLNIYRYIVMNINLEQKTWEQLLIVLLHITSKILPSVPPLKKNETLGGRLSPALFQTLIVTWIKANLNVSISVDLWDQFKETLSSLTLWRELIMEWAKTMETLNRVLARLVYGLDLNDLPLERLSEQKQKKRRGRLPPSESYAPKVVGEMARHDLETNQLSNDPTVAVALHSQNSTECKTTEKLSSRNGAHYSTSDGLGKAASCMSSRSYKGFPISRSASDGCMVPQRMLISSKSSKDIYSGPYEYSQGIVSFSGQDFKKGIDAYNERANLTSSPKTPVELRKSKSLESIVYFRASTPSSFSDASVEGPSRSPSPSLSTGLESNSIKDSPMQIDGVTADNSCSSDMWEGSQEEFCSIMGGGKKKGWLPDVAVAMWRRMLGVLGDVNKISDPEIHALVFQYLVEMFETLVKLRENQGVTIDNQSTPEPPELIPPLNIISPWLFKAVSLSSKFKKGKVYAYRLLCTLTLRLLEEELPEEYLVQFYSSLHLGLCGPDLDIINTVVKYCGPQIFSSRLPGATMLMWDFIHGAETIISSPDLNVVSALEAITVLGALVCIPNITPVIPVLNSSNMELTYIDQKIIKDYVVNLLLRCGLLEHHGAAQRIALCSLGIYLYEELLIGTVLENVKSVIDVLLKTITIFRENVGKVACDVLCLLIDHIDELMKTFPGVPKIIIKSLTTALESLLNSESIGKELECDHLVVSMIFCLGEWCMHVPHKELMDCSTNDEPLLLSAFSVLGKAAFNIQMISNKHSTIISPLIQSEKSTAESGFDAGKETSLPNPDGILENNDNPPLEQYFSPSDMGQHGHVKDDSDPLNIITLAAKMMLSHLNNHLGHFPLGIGATRITSMVNENDDIPGLNFDDLSAKAFNSPHVQFFMLNNNTLLSFVELPVLNVPGGGVTAGAVTAKSQVRVILRDMVGKYSWDCSVLFGTNGSCNDVNTKGDFEDHYMNLMAEHPSARNVSDMCHPLLAMRHSQGDFLPTFAEFPHGGDNLNDLLKYIGNASPECLMCSGKTLNIPQEMCSKVGPDIQEDVMTSVLNQRNYELDYSQRIANDSCMLGKPVPPCPSPDHHTPFQFCRLLINQIGLMSWEKRPHLELLKKNEKLLRELRNVDNQKCRETHKIAVIYVADGQEDKNSVLMNSGGGQAYEEFVAGLAWEVELRTHNGFFGGLQPNGTTGDTAPYYATSLKEVIFHVATRMPTHNEESKIQKLRHLGNDEVHVVWSEHQRDYRRGIITTEFGDVLIVIYPLLNQLYRIQISRKSGVPFFGPLFDGAVVPGRSLSGLVRATSIHASRATRSAMPIFQHFYKERMKALESIIKNHKDLSTFEDFSMDVVLPSCAKKDQGFYSGMDGKVDKRDVLTLSNLAAALLDTQNLPHLSSVNSNFISLPDGVSDTENHY